MRWSRWPDIRRSSLATKPQVFEQRATYFMKIQTFAIGRLKSRPIKELVADYADRLSHYIKFEIHACRDEAQAISKLNPNDFFIVLDERGEQKSSKELADFISGHQMRGTKRLVFFIGGEDGVGEDVRSKANMVLGLSRMTFPHEFTQAILLEQLYRALTIIKGEPYHK